VPCVWQAARKSTQRVSPMAPIAKESDLQNSSAPVNAAGATQTKVQPVALEISVTVNGARSVDGSDKREPFSETTQTVLVFGNGAVIRLNSSVAPGQLLFLTNEKTKKEVVCQVVKSKNYRSVSGYVELEFTEPALGFWGMRFPADRLSPASTPTSAAPVVPAKPILPPAPVAIAPPPAPISTAPTSVAPPVVEKKEAPAPAPVNSASEELKKETARLQEQLSSMLFSEQPAPRSAPSAPQVESKTISDATAKIFELTKAEATASQAKPDLAPATKTFEPLNLSPIAPKQKPATSLHEEEVKIPSWLEPLARNAATPAPPVASPAPASHAATPVLPLSVPTVEASEETDAQVAGESYDFGSKTEQAPAFSSEGDAPNFGTNLFETSETTPAEPASGGGRKGLWIGAIAATVLLAAGGGWWYTQQSGHAAASTTTAAVSQPVSQPAPQQQAQSLSSASSTPATQTGKAFSTPTQMTSQPANTGAPAVTPATEIQKISGGRESAKSAPTSAAIRAAEPVEEKRKSTFNQIHLAAPTVKGGSAKNISNEGEPGIAMENNASPSSGAVSSGLVGSHGGQPVVPIPVGGEVKPVQLLSSVPPVYPQLARSQRISGDVKLDATIDENGRVTGMKVIAGPVMLHQAAMDALHQWKYRPATLDGKPVAMHLLVTIQFRLQ